MSTWARVEDPRARRTRSWVLDVSMTLVVGFIGLVGRTASPVATVFTVLVVVGLTAPLLVRRIWPAQAFTVQLAVAAATGWWTGAEVVSLGLVVGLYTVAALKSRRDALVAAGLLEIGVVAASLRIYANAPWWAPAIAFTGVLVAALALGLYVGTRRTLLAQLRERAAQLERERDQQGELAAAAERSRIAREMHDIVAHHLTVMVALSEGAVATAAKSPDRAVEVMRTVSATGRQALSDTRRLLGVLRDESEEGGERRPLPDLSDLDELVGRVRDAGLPVRYEVLGASPEVPPAVQLTVYRLVQEALTNTMKHAGKGATATVALHYAPDEVSVEVRDDGGVSVDGTPPPGAGRGLAGMRERVHAVGGEVWTGPLDGRGWQVRATLRLAEVVA